MVSGGQRDIIEAVERNDTLFGTRVADRTVNRLDLPAVYPPNTERHKLRVNDIEDRSFSDASFSNEQGKWQLTASDGDTVEFASRERLRYVPNYEMLFGTAAWYETTPSSDQHLYVELSDDLKQNVYRYDFTPGDSKCELISGGNTIDTLPQSEWGNYGDATRYDHDPFEYVDRTTPLNPRGRLSWYGAGPFEPSISYTREGGAQKNPTLGTLSNQNDITTEEVNLRIRVVADADPGADPFTVNVGSMGGLVRGGATEFDRSKAATFFDLNQGSIGPEWENNTPVLAKRVAFEKENVAVSIQPPEFAPGGSTTIELLVIAVRGSDTDASNFEPAPSGDGQNTAVEYTTDVTTFPTETRAVPSGGTDTVPDGRQLAHVVAEGEKNSASKAEAGTATEFKRQLGKDETALYIPRTAPGQTGASIGWLRAINKQDW